MKEFESDICKPQNADVKAMGGIDISLVLRIEQFM